jgi:hypothetical protein
MSVKEVLTKADLSVQQMLDDGGYLDPEQSRSFIRMLQDQPTLLKTIRVVGMKAAKRKIEKVGFGERILRAAPPTGTPLAPGERAAPGFGTVELDTKEVIAEVHLPYDVLEDNIEGAGFETTLMGMIAERASIDLEELGILGDLLSPDPYLALLDGAIKQSTTHLTDAGAVAIGKEVFKQCLTNLPVKYRRALTQLRYYISPDQEINYREVLWPRETSIGDKMIEGRTPVYAFGIPVEPLTFMPLGKMLLTFPKNLIMGIHRDILIETEKDIRARCLVIVLTMRTDFKYEEEDATSSLYNLG